MALARTPALVAVVVSTGAAVALAFGLGFIASDVVKVAIAVTLARWGGKTLRMDELP